MLTAKLLHCIGLQPKDPSFQEIFSNVYFVILAANTLKFLFFLKFDFSVNVDVSKLYYV